ncbi:transposase domain-containing protein [Gigaspora margarita]|uniref:Transposase domain-containing protein n=1 Tax=Gigaspora margarita TaxID=4874 RepID=A0A8H3WWK4_GIGMA|nr:transposase domain-containing protein [Gigaspora margarita]
MKIFQNTCFNIDFGRPPRNIIKHRDGYKAEEWANWITLYSLPLLQNHLPIQFLNGWSKYVQAVKLCQKCVISNIDKIEIRKLFLEFYKHYERHYYKREEARLSTMKICLHYLLHVADIFPQQATKKKYGINIVFTNEDYQEELYFLCIHYTLNQTEIKKLKHIIKQLMKFSTSGLRYARLRTKDGILIGSRTKKRKDIARTNYTVAIGAILLVLLFLLRSQSNFRIRYSKAQMAIDINSAYSNQPSIFRIQEFYGYIEYYFVHEFEGKQYMLAYIQWAGKIFEDNLGLQFFKNISNTEFIDISVIDRCVGFLPIGSITYIIDKNVDSLNNSELDISDIE